MRGAPGPNVPFAPWTWIIPADAGSTDVNIFWGEEAQDHPRGCGEHMYPNVRSWRNSGSSPRMRGAHRLIKHGHLQVGIIPADAGSTQ